MLPNTAMQLYTSPVLGQFDTGNYRTVLLDCNSTVALVTKELIIYLCDQKSGYTYKRKSYINGAQFYYSRFVLVFVRIFIFYKILQFKMPAIFICLYPIS